MKSILHAWLLLCITGIYAQTPITGTVIDANTNEKLPFVNIYFSDIEKGTTTDNNGYFEFKSIVSGNHAIIVSYLGYKTQSFKVTIPGTKHFTISLEPTIIEIEDIIISTPFHKLQSENVMKVERQSINEIKTMGRLALSEGISSIAGVNTISTGVGIGKPVIRGLSGNRVLVYTQGVRLENQQYGDEHGLGISASGIESIEVIKGPASLLYGSDAIGGVLYINPERFAQDNTQSADFNGNYYTNTQGYNTNVGFKSSTEHIKLLFRGSLTEHADYKTNNYRVTNSRFKEQDFKAGIGYQSTIFKTEFRYNANRSKLGIPEEIGVQSTNKVLLLPFQDITNHVFSSKSAIFLNQSKLDIILGYIYNDRKEFEDHHHHEDEDDYEHHEEEEHNHDVTEASLHMKLKTANYDIKYSLPTLGRFETIVGVQGMHQTNTNYGEEILIPNAKTNDLGILATAHVHFDKLDIQLGARYDNRNIDIASGLNKNYNSFNGALGIKTNIFKFIMARLNLASGFRAPNLAELTSNGIHHGTNRYEIGNIGLSNEQNLQTDLALEFSNKHIEVSINGFYNKVNRYIYLSPNDETLNNAPVYTYLQNDANLYGGEIGIHIHPHPLDWLHIESNFETVTGKLRNKNYLPLIPANTLTNTLRVEFDDFWLNKSFVFLKLTSTFNQNHISDFETRTGGYSLLDTGLGGHFKVFNNEVSFTVSATNLTNKTYISHLSRLKPNGIYNMGRNINIGLTYQL
ncbi:MAG: TonB-dependent receptor [Aestuariibaculum sp.]